MDTVEEKIKPLMFVLVRIIEKNEIWMNFFESIQIVYSNVDSVVLKDSSGKV